jgi:hypothetical protein
MAPSWYKARSYRARAVRDPRGVLKEFGTTIPDDVAIQICDSNADTRCAHPVTAAAAGFGPCRPSPVLPAQPAAAGQCPSGFRNQECVAALSHVRI